MPDPYWLVTKTQPSREAFAKEHLEERGFQVFLPLVETGARSSPLFASYIFALVVKGRWLAISRTFGVLSVIRFGDAPARCPDHEIEALRRRADPITSVIRLPSAPPPRAFKSGDRVKIIAGQFASFDAIHTGLSRRAREVVLLTVLGGVREVEVAPHLVEAVKLRPGASGAGQVARGTRL